ncbi:hypothetical protein [Magnetospira sp. QH-2]|uniref:hypothetical protein n=1 Tax=Magnetospira sp. (strain QH-2) TaxID=1288970 RepID=UPI0003E81768|nr:hypothetical protein [Magnetospira sp. QH-2]CCQ73273.1 Conserved membrane protein of unknown function [Magnetospira sp. QH-2]
MSSSFLLAQVIGPLLVVLSMGLLFNRAFYMEMVGELADFRIWTYLAGLLALLFGLLILQWQATWTTEWTVLLTLLGWAGILKGILLLVFPRWVGGWARFYESRPILLAAHGLLILVLGLFLSLKGYQIL